MSSLNIVFNLDIYGVGPMHNQLKALIRDLSLDSKVHLMGFEKNIENVLQNYDLFVLPSKYEGFGLSVLEAIVQRRKIAVARNDALSEVLGAQFPYLFDPDSEESIANTIKEALDAGAEKFYESYERILERYTPERMIKKVSGIYFEVVKSNE
jgi:glycosyltransferase involved in cell wall biosynthesis